MKHLYLLLCLYHTALYAQFPETLELGELNGEDGFVFYGANSSDWTGFAAKSAGDVNNDGLSDFIIGADGAGSSGLVYLIFGRGTGFSAEYQVSDLINGFGLVITGVNTNADFGWSVNGLGDVNDDGVDDFIIGDPRFDRDEHDNTGRTYVIFGDVAGYPDGIDVSNLNGSNGFSITGQSISDDGNSGRSVSAAGDINADGFMDLAIGAPFSDANGFNSGAAYVIYGTDVGFPADIDLNALSISTGFKIMGESEDLTMGWHVMPVDDVNGDGVDDLAISTSNFFFTPDPGFAYVLYGNESGFPAAVQMSNLNGSNGFRIFGSSSSNGNRIVINSAGDWNNDGHADLLIGSLYPSNSGGVSYVMFGQNNDFSENISVDDLVGTTGFSILNPDPTDINIGETAGTAGDINADGIDDLFVSTSSNNSLFIMGFVIFGSESFNQPSFDLAELNGQNGFTVTGPSQSNIGISIVPVAALDDMNGDGINDLGIGNQIADHNGQQVGAAYVIFGREFQDLIFKQGFEE